MFNKTSVIGMINIYMYTNTRERRERKREREREMERGNDRLTCCYRQATLELMSSGLSGLPT